MLFDLFWKKNISSYDIGLTSEDYVKSYLIKRFYKIIATRFKHTNNKRSGLGEIDIIARKGNTIIFIEVKARILKIFFTQLQKNKKCV